MLVIIRSGGLLFLGSAGVPVGRSLLLSGEEGHEVFLVQDAFICASPGLPGLVEFGDLGGLLSDLTGLGEGAVLLAHIIMIINNRYLIIFNIGSISHLV